LATHLAILHILLLLNGGIDQQGVILTAIGTLDGPLRKFTHGAHLNHLLSFSLAKTEDDCRFREGVRLGKDVLALLKQPAQLVE